VFYPGWTIKIDGTASKFYQADLAWMTVPVSKGKHTIELLSKSNYLSKFIKK